ncbi:hypothetical protein [Pantoea ananatis]|uniref:hypothetical protein n=1 Tax=Pantoea ananas TaxID=553 RepID=UPI001F0BBC6C|nr:hypothetical protein [Pantoea ananatis]
MSKSESVRGKSWLNAVAQMLNTRPSQEGHCSRADDIRIPASLRAQPPHYRSHRHSNDERVATPRRLQKHLYTQMQTNMTTELSLQFSEVLTSIRDAINALDMTPVPVEEMKD